MSIWKVYEFILIQHWGVYKSYLEGGGESTELNAVELL